MNRENMIDSIVTSIVVCIVLVVAIRGCTEYNVGKNEVELKRMEMNK